MSRPTRAWDHRRPLKRWCYAGVYGERFMLCAGVAHVAGIPQSFWAVLDRDTRVLRERTRVLHTLPVTPTSVVVADAGVAVDVRLEPDGEPVEVTSPHGRSHIWTRKLPVRAAGTVSIDGVSSPLDGRGLVDESAGYHARVTEWWWSAGVGVATDGAALCWNLVDGVHDGPEGSERRIWTNGSASEVGAASFTATLDRVTFPNGSLDFTSEAVRARRDRLGIISSDYVQPFGTFTGRFGDTTLERGFGVMEHHRAKW